MKRVALLCSEPIRPAMGGIGIRYLEFARRLPLHGLDVVLISPGDPALAPPVPCGRDHVHRFDPEKLGEVARDCDCIVAQGQLANHVAARLPGLPAAYDFYDPFLVENMQYVETLGLEPYHRDLATWRRQFTCGDFFLCSSEEQRAYYLGFLTALGRVNPARLQQDRSLRGLIDVVPFGVDLELKPHRPVLRPRQRNEKRLLFGGLYDWYDPWSLLKAVEQLNRPEIVVFFIRNPNPASTPQVLMGEVEAWARAKGWLGNRVQVHDWVAADRRFDLLRDVDVLVAPHRQTLETQMSLRTRFIDALAAGCPVIMSDGGAMSSLIRTHHAGFVVPPENAQAVAGALLSILDDADESRRCRDGARTLAGQFRWENVLQPLVEFCHNPRKDETRHAFASAGAAPDEAPATPTNRWLRRVFKR